MQTYVLAEAKSTQPFLKVGEFLVFYNHENYFAPLKRVAMMVKFNGDTESVKLDAANIVLDSDKTLLSCEGIRRFGQKVTIRNPIAVDVNKDEGFWYGLRVKVPLEQLVKR